MSPGAFHQQEGRVCVQLRGVCACEGVGLGVAVSGTIAPFPPSDKQSITNYFRHKADDSDSTDMIKLYEAKIQL